MKNAVAHKAFKFNKFNLSIFLSYSVHLAYHVTFHQAINMRESNMIGKMDRINNGPSIILQERWMAAFEDLTQAIDKVSKDKQWCFFLMNFH
jgi:hypothetical protein